jgi:hypothetical protein
VRPPEASNGDYGVEKNGGMASMRRFDVEEMINEGAHALARREVGEAGARTYKRHLERTMQAHNHLNSVASVIQRSYRCHIARGVLESVYAGEASRQIEPKS